MSQLPRSNSMSILSLASHSSLVLVLPLLRQALVCLNSIEIKLGCKCLPGTKALAYFALPSVKIKMTCVNLVNYGGKKRNKRALWSTFNM
jgi:hypothetical protein